MTAERKSGIILAILVAIEGGWVLMNLQISGWRFVRYLGFAPGLTGRPAGWIGAALVTLIFVALSLRLPSVRENLFRPTLLKLLGIALAISAGILEEVMFRRWTMNWLMAHGQGAFVQVLGAGAALRRHSWDLGSDGEKLSSGPRGHDCHRISRTNAWNRLSPRRPQSGALHCRAFRY